MRQHEGRGLAGAGLRAGEHVAAGENRGNRLGLNGSRRAVTTIGERTRKFGNQPESGKRHGDDISSTSLRKLRFRSSEAGD